MTVEEQIQELTAQIAALNLIVSVMQDTLENIKTIILEQVI